MEKKLTDILSVIHSSHRWNKNLTAWQHLAASDGFHTKIPDHLHPKIKDELENRGIDSLYLHQSESIDAVQNGRHAVIVTPTSSGKTLCYNLPVLHRMTTNPGVRALYLFPTKALAQDQLAELNRWFHALNILGKAATYDGDTPSNSRPSIRKNAPIVLSNPDMLHAGILPHHTKWAEFFSRLEFVVIDELHIYRGVFGSHLANVIRRLARICAFYKSNPTFILCSATLANPQQLAEKMIGQKVHLISKSGAPTTEKDFLFYNPPLVNPMEGIRRSYLAEAVSLAKLFLETSIQTIVFVRSRLNVEMVLKELRASLRINPNLIRGYRGGYLPSERRSIETGLRNGSIRGVIATSALELGIDIGDLGVSILAGYPGTIASSWQRAGRAGRRKNRSVALFIASPAPLDQFVVKNPDYFFQTSPEHALINPDNLLILLDHIRCAAFELPFRQNETFHHVADTAEYLGYLEEEGDVRNTGTTWHFTGKTYPAERISLRSLSPDTFTVCEETGSAHRIIAEVDELSAHYFIHPQAVYIHEGNEYFIEELDFDKQRARAIPFKGGYFTFPMENTTVNILEVIRLSEHQYHPNFGELEVLSRVIGFKKAKFHTLENLGFEMLDMPERQLMTTGLWINIPIALLIDSLEITGDRLIYALKGLLTAMSSVACVLLMSDPKDIGTSITSGGGGESLTGEFFPVQQQHEMMRKMEENARFDLFIFDRYPGGIGLAEELMGLYHQLITSTIQLIRECGCRSGCPSCTGPLENESLGVKTNALKILHIFEKSF